MKEYVLGCINKRIDANAHIASEARRLCYQEEEMVRSHVIRELQDLKREIEDGYLNPLSTTSF
jgi:rRNA maturation endonuclease Nob1